MKNIQLGMLVAVCLLFSSTSMAESYEEKVQASLKAIGQTIEPINLISLDGQHHTFNELRGSSSIIYFFAYLVCSLL